MSRGAEAEAVWLSEPDENATAESAQRAKSVTQGGALPLSLPLRVVTQREARERAQAAADAITGVASALAAGQHVHGHVKSMAEARAAVHEAAAAHNGLALKSARLVYGYLWLSLKAALNSTEVLAEHPLILAACALVVALTALYA